MLASGLAGNMGEGEGREGQEGRLGRRRDLPSDTAVLGRTWLEWTGLALELSSPGPIPEAPGDHDWAKKGSSEGKEQVLLSMEGRIDGILICFRDLKKKVPAVVSAV